jgi:hypothetical protein
MNIVLEDLSEPIEAMYYGKSEQEQVISTPAPRSPNVLYYL